MFGLHIADVLVLGLYLLGITAIGIWAARRIKTIADFFMPRRFGKVMMITHAFGMVSVAVAFRDAILLADCAGDAAFPGDNDGGRFRGQIQPQRRDAFCGCGDGEFINQHRSYAKRGRCGY